MEKGSDLVLIDIGVILFSIGLMLLLNKYIKGDKNLILLLGIGTGRWCKLLQQYLQY
ncbi:hypothetical protein ACV566_16785 [Staphylococcus aureus]